MRRFSLILAAALLALPPPFELPPPTGVFPVGTTTWHVTDAARRESFAAGDRQIEVHAFYPRVPPRAGDVTFAPYLREGLAEVRVFAKLLRAPDTAFDALADVRTHAVVDAPPAVAPRLLPLLVFSHGFTSVPSAHTALLEDLASHGYAVLSIVHPYEATAATLADGKVVTLLDASGAAPHAAIRDVFSEWAAEDETMTKVTAAANEDEQLRLLRGYLAGLKRTDETLHRWVEDTEAVLDKIAMLPADTPAGRLGARLDLQRIGAFGHSMGGVAAAQFCAVDRRCLAALNIDGSPQSGPLIDRPMAKPFLMVYSARPGRAGANDAIYRRAAKPYYRVDVADTRHLDFIDMAFWGGPLRERPALGPIAPARIAEITRAIVRQYFDQTLLAKKSAILDGAATYPEVTVGTITR